MNHDFLSSWKTIVLNGVPPASREVTTLWKNEPLLKGGMYGAELKEQDIINFLKSGLVTLDDVAFISLDPDLTLSSTLTGFYAADTRVLKDIIFRLSDIFRVFVIGPARRLRDADNLTGFQTLQHFYQNNPLLTPSIILHATEQNSSTSMDSAFLHLSSMTEKILR